MLADGTRRAIVSRPADGPQSVGQLAAELPVSRPAVTHIDAPRTWGVQGIDGPIRATVDVTVEPVTETSSRLTIAVDFDGHGIGKLLVPLIVRRQAHKEMPANVEALKRRVEAEQPHHPG